MGSKDHRGLKGQGLWWECALPLSSGRQNLLTSYECKHDHSNPLPPTLHGSPVPSGERCIFYHVPRGFGIWPLFLCLPLPPSQILPSVGLISPCSCPCPTLCLLFLLPSSFASPLTPIIFQVSAEMPLPPGSLPEPHYACSHGPPCFCH